MSASVLFEIMESKTDLPTPDPATIPILCPLPIVKFAFIFLIPTSRTSLIGFLLNGFIDVPFKFNLASHAGAAN